MANSIDLNNQKWCDIVFEGRNKDYGAYAIRRSSAKRYNIAAVCMVLGIAAIVGLAGLYQLASNAMDKVAVTEVNELSTLKQKKKPEVKQKQLEVEQKKPEEQKLKSTVKLTEPVIKKDELVKEEFKSQDELMNQKAAISIADVKGNDENGADIADVRQVVVEKPIEKAPVEVEEKVFDVVEQMPSFPGGDAALMQYLQKSIRYPVVAEENGIQGRVIIRFVVEKNGSIGEVQVARSVDPSLDKEAVRVVKSMPKWIPGKQNGSAVRVWFTLPVQFRLQ
ncbi:MAG: energy transducer TonB [Prevotella sp.]|nr:energy transducer TonB [Candidatus Equicola faecalis]